MSVLLTSGLSAPMSTHTPGPWVVSHDKKYDQQRISANDAPIAVTKDEANARLIAAAPDLLDVARNVGGIDDGWLKGAHPELLRKAILQIRDEARAAIAKAEGAS